ncbi:unnamed protein product, partial [Allacma fusca]
NLEPRLTDSR